MLRKDVHLLRCTHLYTHTERERDRERERDADALLCPVFAMRVLLPLLLLHVQVTAASQWWCQAQ